MHINDSFDKFLKEKESYCAAKTCDYYKNVLHIFRIYLLEKNIVDTSAIDADLLRDFVLSLRNKDIKNTSINTYMRAVKNYCSWCIYNSCIEPFDYKIKLPRPDPDQILPLSTSEVSNILKYIQNDCSKSQNKELFFRLLLDCGMRSREALMLTREDIDLDTGIIQIRKSKYNKNRMIPLPACVRSLVPDQEGFLFSFGESGKHDFFVRMRKQTGIQRVRAHLLRHTFATSYMVKVGNLEFLRMYMGHSTYNVTQNYIQSAYQCNLLKYDIYKIDDIFT